jgi:hypothetical protein
VTSVGENNFKGEIIVVEPKNDQDFKLFVQNFGWIGP